MPGERGAGLMSTMSGASGWRRSTSPQRRHPDALARRAEALRDIERRPLRCRPRGNRPRPLVVRSDDRDGSRRPSREADVELRPCTFSETRSNAGSEFPGASARARCAKTAVSRGNRRMHSRAVSCHSPGYPRRGSRHLAPTVLQKTQW
jgi:hypothetical protein